MCYPAEFGRSTSKGTNIIKEIRLKIWPSCTSFQVIITDADRSAAYYFLVTFHSNHGPISYAFQNRRWFPWKIAIFPHPRVLCTHAEGVPLDVWYQRRGSKELEWWGYRAVKEVWRYLQPSGYNTPTWQTDGRADRRTDAGRQQRSHLRISLRGNYKDLRGRAPYRSGSFPRQ